MIRWHRVKPTLETPRTLLTRVKRKRMGLLMKKLHDLTHETKIILHKFEKVLPQKEEVLADKILAPPHTDSEDEEPVVKRKRGSRNMTKTARNLS